MRCLGYISPNIDQDKPSSKFSTHVHPSEQVSKITYDPDFRNLINKQEYFRNVSSVLEGSRPFGWSPDASETARMQTLYDGLKKKGLTISKIDLIETMVRDQDNQYVASIPPRDLEGIEASSIIEEDRDLENTSRKKAGTVRVKLHSNNAKVGWNKSTKAN